MKKAAILSLLLFSVIWLHAQTDGISYQAVIIDPNSQEIPGVDVEGNFLPFATVAIRFTIYDETNQEEFQEVQITETDRYGLIDLIIGSVRHEEFTRINWTGRPKDLSVEIDFTGAGNDFISLSRQMLTYVPYVSHRDITASGFLEVDGITELNSSITVDGPANLNSTLDVNNNNATNLTGSLNVDGSSQLNDWLRVAGTTFLMDSLTVFRSPSDFGGKIDVADTATFNGPARFNAATVFNAPASFVEINVSGPANLAQVDVTGHAHLAEVDVYGHANLAEVDVNGPSDLRGQVIIDANLDAVGDKNNFDAYPLQVKGSNQGIAVKVNGSRNSDNNFISFWDTETNQLWGRIEGQTISELEDDPEYNHDMRMINTSIAVASIDMGIAGFEAIQAAADLVGAATSSTACVGFGACVTTPVPSLIIAAGTNLVLKAANAVSMGLNLDMAISDEDFYTDLMHDNIGVTLQSGSGDYAEWLPKANISEKLMPGDLVGVRNGKVTKSTSGAEKVMVVSTSPIVLGNMPQPGQEKNYAKIAFMGQVPVKVIGSVNQGDYILPNILSPGMGVAVHPDDMHIADYKKIVGVAWSEGKSDGFNMVNVAVGINTNDLTSAVVKQQQKIDQLQSKIDELEQNAIKNYQILSELIPGYAELAESPDYSKEIDNRVEHKKPEKTEAGQTDNGMILATSQDDIVYYKPSREQLESSIEQAKAIYLQSGKKMEDHPFWKKMKEEPAYMEEMIEYMERQFDKAVHTHKNTNRKFSE